MSVAAVLRRLRSLQLSPKGELLLLAQEAADVLRGQRGIPNHVDLGDRLGRAVEAFWDEEMREYRDHT